MGSFFSGISRIFRAIGSIFGYKTNSIADSLLQSPAAISGTYDNIVDEKRKSVNHFKDAVSGLVAQQEDKKGKLANLTDEVAKYEKMKAGALARAKDVATKYNGDQAKTQADPDYIKHQSAYRDFSTTLEEKQKQVSELEADISKLQTSINTYTNQLMTQKRDLENIAQEKNETIADVLSAKEQQKINDLVSGLGKDSTSKDLQKMRDVRAKAKASAAVSEHLAGTDTNADDAAYEAAASSTVHDDEFAKMMGFASDKPAAAPTEAVTTTVPEK